jgi:hypothetical protein
MLFENYTFESATIKALALEAESTELSRVLIRAERIVFSHDSQVLKSEWEQFRGAIEGLNRAVIKKD